MLRRSITQVDEKIYLTSHETFFFFIQKKNGLKRSNEKGNDNTKEMKKHNKGKEIYNQRGNA